MIKDEKIKFAVIGFGHIGKRHASMITRNSECELVALCDTASKESLKIEDFRVPFFSSIDDLINSAIYFDVLCIATPNGLHEEHSLKRLSNKHHIVV
jgi:predicted dehydrogenase